MSDEAMRGLFRAFCDALISHESTQIADWLDDDIDWIVFGPIDLFPFFGQRKGRNEVLEMYAQVGNFLTFKHYDKDTLLIEGERAAVLTKLSAAHKRTGRTLSLRLAMFAEFRDGKVVRLRTVFDSFDAAEQALGREIDLTVAA
jgi:ketosteroid isomerase-like protein